MTKTDRIRALIKAGKTSREIADEVGCHDSYVRTVKQRDAGIDFAGNYRRRMLAAGRNRPDAVEATKVARRQMYRELRDAGFSSRIAAQRSSGRSQYAMIKYVANNSTPT